MLSYGGLLDLGYTHTTGPIRLIGRLYEYTMGLRTRTVVLSNSTVH